MTKDETQETLAPSVETGWRDDFVVELRLIGASGATIADALVEVEGHCRESGQSAIDAFGPAVEYARALDLPDESGWTRGQLVRTWVGLLLLVGGFSLTLLGGFAFFLEQGQRAEITLGWLVGGGAGLVGMVLIGVFGKQIMRLAVEHTVWTSLGFTAAVVAVVAVGLPFENVHLGSVPALIPLIVGIAALLGWVVLTLVLRWTGHTLDDPLIAPEVTAGRHN